MKFYQGLALIFIIAAVLFTGLAGMTDILENEGMMTKHHLWIDGVFLLLLAIAILCLGRSTA
jgi:hypothetical protein